MKRLCRSRKSAIIGGVCAGVADYFDWNATNVRWAKVQLALFSVGILAYVVLWIVLPVQD